MLDNRCLRYEPTNVAKLEDERVVSGCYAASP
jgi:hypothetical protein